MSRYSKAIKRLLWNYTYDLKQLHKDFGFHPQTVRGWIKEFNLPVIQEHPILIFSEVIREHLSKQEKERKLTLELHQFFCPSCKCANTPFENKVHFEDVGKWLVLRGYCSSCKGLMRKPQSKQKLATAMPMFKRITLEELNILGRAISNEKTHLEENTTSTPNEPTTNSHLQKQTDLFKDN